MNYLQPSEYSNFGLDAATNEAFITAASRLIDAHCRRATLAPQAYTERHRLASGRNTLLLTHLPVISLTSTRGRFAKPRRDESQSNDLVIAISGAFGLPGTWTDLDVASFDLDLRTGEVSLPAHPLGLAYNEVEITYQSGMETIGDDVKVACAQIVKNMAAVPAMNLKSSRIDKLKIEYFSDSLIDGGVQKLLAPYVAQKVA
jgi:hypothetical protein